MASSLGLPRRRVASTPTRDRREMSSYAHENLLELEDATGGRVEGLEGRFGRTHLDSRDLGVSHFRYAPGLRSSVGHRHREQEEAYVVVSGSGRMLLDDQVVELKLWDVVRVADRKSTRLNSSHTDITR